MKEEFIRFIFFIPVKPEFIDLTPMIEIKSGESRIINLTATANPSDCTYVLKRGSEVINEGTIRSFSLSAGVLTISAISKEDSGDYTITASNSQGSASFDFSVDVQCKYIDAFCTI